MKGMLFNYELGLFTATVEGRKNETRRLALEGPLSTPRYKVGERLYLKEPIIRDLIWDPDRRLYPSHSVPPISYKYNYSDLMQKQFKWSNKLFMAEKDARYFIEITDTHTEQLHDITEESCIKEGIQPLLMSNMQLMEMGQLYRNYTAKKALFNEGVSAIESYKSLWDKINKKKCPWDSNPWVHVYNYKLVK
jgi:hypothetical protein